MNNILIIGIHTTEKFLSKNKVQKLIQNYKNIYHIAICYDNNHYLYKNNMLIKHIKIKDNIKAYTYLVKLLSQIRTKFRLITFWGHGWGAIFGTITYNSPIISAYDFAKPLIRNKISSFFLWLEGCNLGNIITLLDCYPISKYMIGSPNSYGGHTLLNYIKYIKYIKYNNIKIFKKICKLVDLKNRDCYIIYKTKYTYKLIDYLSSIDLSTLNWDDKRNKKNIKKGNPNVYNLEFISSDPILKKILNKIVPNDNKCYVNIDKHIYYNIYNESLRNTYYKILNKKSKQFYISNPHTYAI